MQGVLISQLFRLQQPEGFPRQRHSQGLLEYRIDVEHRGHLITDPNAVPAQPTNSPLFWPLIVFWRWFRFEVERWSESDHPWISSTSEDE